MAIRDIVTGGFGNGTFSGTIALVVTRGYAIGEAVAVPPTLPYRPFRVESEDSHSIRVESESQYSTRIDQHT